MLNRSFWFALAGGGLFSLVGVGWLAREVTQAPDSRPQAGLLEMLQEMGRPRSIDGTTPRRQVSTPPPMTTWRSRLRCEPVDPKLKIHLDRLSLALKQRAYRLSTHPTNFGERFNQDAFGRPVDPTPRVVVLHETVYGLNSAMNTFLTPHPRDEDQVSYHTLIGLRGEVVQVLDPSSRAFGAGNSAFNGQWVITNRNFRGSVNNFALHLSLETPVDGENAGSRHSGYTEAQYDALAVVLADWMKRFPVLPENITTHRAVDLGGERSDPRSFNWKSLQRRLAALGHLC